MQPRGPRPHAHRPGPGEPRTGNWESVLAALRRHMKGNAPEELVRLASAAHRHGALAGKDVLAIGSDVSVAAAVALAGKALSPGGKLARRVVAAQPDERALTRLRDIATAERVILGLVRCDPNKALLPDLQGEFDTLFVSSAGGLEDASLLLSRAVVATKAEGGTIFLLAASGSPEELLDLQSAITEMGLLIEELDPRFGSSQFQQLYVLRVFEGSVPLVEGDEEDKC